MKRNNHIHRAIDESLDSVRFNAHDTRAVLSTVQRQSAKRRAHAPKRRLRLDLILTMSMAALILVPLSVFALRARRADISDITAGMDPIVAASSGDHSANTQNMSLSDADPSAVSEDAFSPVISESEAIQAARACFEALCDTSVFTFEEYTVSVQAAFSYGSDPASANYEVAMKSIYGNGCSFTVVVSAQDGRVISYSTPKLATIPAFLDSDSAEIRAWYDKHGEYLFAWPMDVQAEFSRRYEGAMLRLPREGEKDAQYIASAGVPKFHDKLTENADNPEHSYSLSWYPMLYDGRAFADGQARYRIYCFAFDEQSNEVLPVYLLATMLAAEGTIESMEVLPTDSLKP